MVLPHHPLADPTPLSEPELEEWEEAYAAVEAYFQALRLRNRLLVAELVRKVLWRASSRRATEPGSPARVLAMEEALAEIATWTRQVLDEPLEHSRMAARGRLALLLAGMPDKWQGVFLTPPPWPPEFVAAMRSAYLVAAPGFAGLPMEARPLDLNVFGSSAAQWWDTLDRRPIVRTMFVGAMILLAMAAVWFVYG
ncbi:MAG: hypothetical protein MUF04_05495 [Akkermansiaceae bacterium]|jgi:hypothetical protein|nr:hypothetical protein [Akkermansiaceae bacterium]